MLDDVRVVDRTTEIAGPYCSKLLADAGADVVKVEPPGGDPLRRWRSGALFDYLNTSKRSVPDGEDLLAAADVLISNEPVDTVALWSQNPALVVVIITPFGCDGPWAGRPATEFTLQAACGSIGQRGLPEHPPLSAGGRLGEWTSGTYAALGALAALREARRSGRGDLVDVAMLDCMAVTMVTYPSVFASFFGWPELVGTGRTIEVPSIEPTRDGYFVVTTNSAQQFQDFLLMIERPDLMADPDLPQVAKRFRRREAFLSAVHEYTTRHTTDEILEAAALYRIPAGPLLDGSTMTRFEQFAARHVFVPNPSERFVQPRVPYRISGHSPRPFDPAPGPGQDDGPIEWPPRTGSAPEEAVRAGRTPSDADADGWQLPLAGIRVVDCTAWWAGPIATAALANLGADVIKIESVTRPDNMRFASTRPPASDHWWEWSPIFHAANAGKRGVTFDLSRPDGREMFERLLQTADVLVENFTPRVMEQFGLDWDRVHALNDRLIMVRMPAFGLDGPWRDRTGFAQTMECLTGLAWLTGFAEGPPTLVRGACDPLAGMHAVVATLLALTERDRGGQGSLVESAMVESILNAAAEQVVEYGASGAVLCRSGNRGAQAAPQGVYPCAGEDEWVAIAIVDDDGWRSLRSVLGDPDWMAADGLEHVAGRRRAHDRIDDELARWTGARSAEDAAEVLLDVGIPSSVVLPPREIAANPQLRHRGLFEVEEHAITGNHEIPGLPIRFSRVTRWLRTPAPTLGRDNDVVLEELGYSPAAIAGFRQSGLIGDVPEGL